MDLPKSQNNENKQSTMDKKKKTEVVYWYLKFLMCGKIMAKAV